MGGGYLLGGLKKKKKTGVSRALARGVEPSLTSGVEQKKPR